jgi:hypothetical protein
MLFETGSRYVAQNNLEFQILQILLPQLPSAGTLHQAIFETYSLLDNQIQVFRDFLYKISYKY